MTAFPRRLIEGYRNFKASRLDSLRDRYSVLGTLGQRPDTMIIGCCDSRAAPEIIFDAAPGELFVVRNVANLVPPYESDGHFHGTSAAIEFGIKALKMRNVLVLGHGKCGGIEGHLNGAGEQSDFLGQWLKLVDPAAKALREARLLKEDCQHHLHSHYPRGAQTISVVFEIAIKEDRHGLLAAITSAIMNQKGNIVNANIGPAMNRITVSFSHDDWAGIQSVRQTLAAVDGVGSVEALIPDFENKADRQRALELKAIEFSLKNLQSFPIVKDLERIGELNLHGAWFDISTGQLLTFDRVQSKWQEPYFF